MEDQLTQMHTPDPAAESGPATARASGVPVRQRHEGNGLVIDHDLPDQLPILPAEIDLFRLYFADLLDDALKAPT
jgi:hypothetical protein